VPALSLHEAVPGHHHQIALQQELDLPPFRRNFSSFTAFTEGWGLYAESLGEEMGLYDSPAKKMGQLSYQMWRAARLVRRYRHSCQGLGQGARGCLHARMDRAVGRQYRRRGEPLHQLARPGARLHDRQHRIRELRARAEKELGSKFDLRRFHDAVLLQGSVPLDVLERQVTDWVAAEKMRA
jgi:uncharacterized protein (DUF885 family)